MASSAKEQKLQNSKYKCSGAVVCRTSAVKRHFETKQKSSGQKKVKCGTYHELFDCATAHICDCGLADDYNKCWMLTSDEVIEKGYALFAEYFPGDYTKAHGFSPVSTELCKRGNTDTTLEAFSYIKRELTNYANTVQANPFRSKEALQNFQSRIMACCCAVVCHLKNAILFKPLFIRLR
ncbi:hypothetical protein TNCV_2438541 [Trichonephila clavipes]|nr:hypothetical protein TNCV_2438541 [Trichonephila clavipes]